MLLFSELQNSTSLFSCWRSQIKPQIDSCSASVQYILQFVPNWVMPLRISARHYGVTAIHFAMLLCFTPLCQCGQQCLMLPSNIQMVTLLHYCECCYMFSCACAHRLQRVLEESSTCRVALAIDTALPVPNDTGSLISRPASAQLRGQPRPPPPNSPSHAEVVLKVMNVGEAATGLQVPSAHLLTWTSVETRACWESLRCLKACVMHRTYKCPLKVV